MSGGRRTPVPEWVPDDLPRSAGVYQFEDARGAPLYVGKSVNVRRRVRSYFYSGGPADPRLVEMLCLARRVDARSTGTDLEARLEEADRIARHRPPYNRALKNRARGWWLEIDWAEPFPRIRVVRAARRARSQYFGPFRGRRAPAALAALAEKLCRLRSCPGAVRPDPRASPCLQHGIGLCTAPCAKVTGLDAYRKQVRQAARLLAGAGLEPLRRELAHQRQRAVQGERRVEAADLGRRLAWLEELEERRRILERPCADRSWMLVLPGAKPGAVVFVPVARGRVLPRLAVVWADGWEPTLRDACYAVRLAELRVEAPATPWELALSVIVAGWLEAGAPGGFPFDLTHAGAEELVAELRARGVPPRAG